MSPSILKTTKNFTNKGGILFCYTRQAKCQNTIGMVTQIHGRASLTRLCTICYDKKQPFAQSKKNSGKQKMLTGALVKNNQEQRQKLLSTKRLLL